MRLRSLVPTALVVVLAAGCGDPPPPPRPDDVARREALEAAPRPTPSAEASPTFDPEDRGQLVEIYCRIERGDNAVWADHGLVDARGLPDPAQVSRYQGAVQALHARPEAWKRFQADVAACKARAGR